MSNGELLERRVVASLRPRIGEMLRSVAYRCLAREAMAADLHDPDFYMGGELLLTFDGGPLFISWDENAGWRTHFSIQSSETPLVLLETAVESYDGSSLSLWSPHVGSPLTDAQVLGWEGVPYAVLLSFNLGSVVVASSWETRIGDADDIIVREASYLDHLPLLEVLWRYRPTA